MEDIYRKRKVILWTKHVFGRVYFNLLNKSQKPWCEVIQTVIDIDEMSKYIHVLVQEKANNIEQ